MQILSMSELLAQLKQDEIEYGQPLDIPSPLIAEFAEVASKVRESTHLAAKLAANYAYIQALMPVVQAKIRKSEGVTEDTPVQVDLELNEYKLGTKKVQAPKPPDWVDDVLKDESTPPTLM